MPNDLREVVARAIFEAENGIDGDRIGTMIYENFRIEDRNGDMGIGETMLVCKKAADAALEAIRGAGFAVVPVDPTLDMLQSGREAAKATRPSGVSGMTLDAQIRSECAREGAVYRAMLAASQGKGE